MSEELKPCPFCGGELTITKHFKYDLYGGIHRNCSIGAISFDFTELNSIVTRWNNRAESPELAELRAELARMKSFHTCAIHGDIKWKQWGCPDCVHELRTEVARLRSEREWRPIADAPDGDTACLLYVHGDVVRGYRDRGLWFEVGYILPLEPTHWQPLPPPPTEETNE